MNKKRRELLKIIALEANCTYISDLCDTQNLKAVKDAVKSIPAADFSVQEWKGAVEYILGKHIEIETQQQGKDQFGTG